MRKLKLPILLVLKPKAVSISYTLKLIQHNSGENRARPIKSFQQSSREELQL